MTAFLKNHLLIIGLCLSCLSVNAQIPQFWGVYTPSTSASKYSGMLYKTDFENDSIKIMHHWDIHNAVSPEITLKKHTNGKLYGTSRGNWRSGDGTIFEYDPTTGKYSEKYVFDGSNVAGGPGELLLANDGKFYGLSRYGGREGGVKLFEYDPNLNSLKIRFDFNEINGLNGDFPYGSLLQASNGKLYGTTRDGGINKLGVMFEFDLSTNSYKKLYDFNVTYGGAPYGSLTQADNGLIYGTTNSYGNIYGTIFSYDIDKKVFEVEVYLNYNIGSYPRGGLLQASPNKLYGMMSMGGVFGNGTIIEFDTQKDTCIVIHSFGKSAGSYPLGDLMLGQDGLLYGMTYYGGSNNKGALFAYDLNTKQYFHKHDFDGYLNGESPSAGLVQVGDRLIGVTSKGGAHGYGVLFEYNLTNEAYKKILNFSGNEGENPYSGLLQGSDNKLYGLMHAGGLYAKGLFYSYDPHTGQYNEIFHFNGTNGVNPSGPMIQAKNGKIYGTTFSSDSGGSIFEYEPLTNTYVQELGLHPDMPAINSGLCEGENGILYGLTYSNAPYINGSLFSYNPSNKEYKKCHDFLPDSGQGLGSRLLYAKNGKLYGVSLSGGRYRNGTLFEYDPITERVQTKIAFDGGNGQPHGEVIQASNDKIYGVVSFGNSLFEYDYSTDSLRYIKFSADVGGAGGFLTEASNGKLYGILSVIGASDNGGVFEYDIVEDSIRYLLGFKGTARYSVYGKLIELEDMPIAIEDETINKNNLITIYPNPTKDWVYVVGNDQSRILQIELLAADGRIVKPEMVSEKNNVYSLYIPKQAGLYYVRVRDDKSRVVYHKVIKE